MARLGYRSQETAARYRAAEALLRQLPNYFVTAEDVAGCLGLSVQSTSALLAELATTGAIECRMTTWRASRCRTRKRREYRFVENRSQWPRHPDWLEPPLHPIDQTKCRRITGRNHIKERSPMTEAEYRALPRNIREKFNDLSDEQFAGHPDVVAARERLEAAEAAHRSACEATHQLRTRKVQIENLCQVLKAQRNDFHDSRIQHVADALVTKGAMDASIETDRQLAERIATIDLVLLAAPRAQGDLDAQLVALNRRVQLAVNDCQSANEDHRATLDNLKLAMAQA